MLEVYDRVVNSENATTLTMLTLLVAFFYLILELLELVKAHIIHKCSIIFDEKVRDRLFTNIFQGKLKHQINSGAQSLMDLRIIQEIVEAPGFLSIFDVPFSLMVILFIFTINPTLGWFTISSVILLGLLTILNNVFVHPKMTVAGQESSLAMIKAESILKNSEVIDAMGMLPNIVKDWTATQKNSIYSQAQASDAAGAYSALSKLTQTLTGSLLLGIGCWLTLKGEMQGGGSGMVVASFLGGRAGAPLVAVIGQWRQMVRAFDSYKRLDEFITMFPEKRETMELPQPKGQLSVENLMVSAPGSHFPIIRGISFKMPAGHSLAIVGPSASGKSTLGRLIVGVWPANSGSVRLDGADIYAWNKAELGPHMGYLPQDIELFDGTIAENIARFGDVDMHKVREAAQIAGLEEFIDNLAHGFETRVGDEGSFLSGGQRQRIGLARALYGTPAYIVLDEPNSSLDEQGETALLNALQYMKSKNSTVIVITHRASILAIMDFTMVLVEGQINMIGPTQEVLSKLQGKPTPAPAAFPAPVPA